MPSLSKLVGERFAAQTLTGTPAVSPEAVVGHLLAVQGQDPRGARLSVRARSSGLSASDVDRAFTDNRTLIITWVNRGTLHLITSEDYSLLRPLTTPQLAVGNARRLQQENVSPSQAERATKLLRKAIGSHGPQTRDQLRDVLREKNLPVAGQALVHILFLATLKGLIVRGPMSGKQHCFALVDDWLGPQKRVPREKALAELARRYLMGHAPADARDLAQWANIRLRDSQEALRSISSQTIERSDGLLQLRDQKFETATPPTKWLGSFDPILHGWSSREWLLADHFRHIVSGGIFRPFVLDRGHPVATCSFTGGTVKPAAFPGVALRESREMASERQDVLRFLSS